MTTNFEKAFDSCNHAFLIAAPKNMVLVTIWWTGLNLIEELVKGIQYQHISLFLHWRFFSL